MGKILSFICLLICLEPNFGFQGGIINDDSISNTQYFLVKNQGDIKVYNKVKPKKGYIEYKASIVLSDVKIKEVIHFLIDYANHDKWVYRCIKSQLLEKEGNTYLYQVIKSQWPFKKRDYILQLKQEQLSEDCFVMRFFSKPSYLPQKNECVRISEFESQWVVKREKSSVKILVYSSFNPKASMSSFLMKNYSRVIPLRTLMNLKHQLLVGK